MNDFFVALCNWCIAAMEYFSAISGISYSAINIILFVILGPLSTLLFMIAWVLAFNNKKKPSIVFSIIGALIVISVLIISIYSMLMVQHRIVSM